MPSIKQNTDGSLRIEGKQFGKGGFCIVNAEYGTSAADKVVFVAPRDFRLVDLSARPTVADSQAGTIVMRKCSDSTAIGSGTALHDSSILLNGTALVTQHKTVSTAAGRDTNLIPRGTAIAMDVTTATTSGTGVVTLLLAPA